MESNFLAPYIFIGAALVLLFTYFFIRIKKNKALKRSAKEILHAVKDDKNFDKEDENLDSDSKITSENKETKKESIDNKISETKWYDRLKLGLKKTQGQLIRGIDDFFLSKQEKASRHDALENLFEILIQADVGVRTSELLVEKVKNRITKDEISDVNAFKEILREEILNILSQTHVNPYGTIENPTKENSLAHVVMMVGVNGVGKTTTTGKLAYKAHLRGQKVVIGAADTFRAAAVEQLSIWAERSHADLIKLKEGSDPASVAFETIKRANENNADLCLVDTAGRLQNRQDLMQELAKIGRVMKKENANAPHEVLLVLDATTGQNAIQQAKIFKEVVQITGLILTKLDGTAKGGVAIAIASELALPIRYVGVGESVEDLEIFNANEFVSALFEN